VAAEGASPKAAKKQQPPKPEVPNDHGPDVPVDVIRGWFAAMHERFVGEFEEKERLLLWKIKELQFRLREKPRRMKK
jgi:hypothetical protein